VSLQFGVPVVLVRSYVMVMSLGRLPVAARVMVAAEYVGIVLEDVYVATSTTLANVSHKKIATLRLRLRDT